MSGLPKLCLLADMIRSENMGAGKYENNGGGERFFVLKRIWILSVEQLLGFRKT